MSVLVVGDVVTDTVVRLQQALVTGGDAVATITDSLGGQGANVARWLVTAGVEAVRLLGTRSSNDLADHTAALLRCGVRPELFALNAPAPRIVVLVDSAGSDRSFLTQRGAAAGLDVSHAQSVDLGGVEWCHVSGYVLASATGQAFYARLRQRCNDAHIPLSVDPSSISEIAHHGAHEFLHLIGHVSLLVPNEAEALTLSQQTDVEQAANRLSTWANIVVVKRGPAGALATEGDTTFQVPAIQSNSVDPTGAGDAFAAGLIAALVGGSSLIDAVGAGNRFGAQAVARNGAF
jgi:sugar/nucleoside kinase (ribokinase family)